MQEPIRTYYRKPGNMQGRNKLYRGLVSSAAQAIKMGKAPNSRALREIKHLLCEQSLFLYYLKQIDSMLPCICPVIDH